MSPRFRPNHRLLLALLTVLGVSSASAQTPTVIVTSPPSVSTFVGHDAKVIVSATTSVAGSQPLLVTTPLAPNMHLRQLTAGQTSTWEVSLTPRPGDDNRFVCFQVIDQVTGVSSVGVACTSWLIQPAPVIGLTGVIRTFAASHSDMNRPTNEAASPLPDFVAPQLGADSKPFFTSASSAGVTHFNEWFNDVAGVNHASVHSIYLSNNQQLDPNVFSFASANWQPVEAERYFTFEGHTAITYTPGLQFTFKSADDLWIYINHALIPGSNLHGVHAERSLTVALDTLGLQPGGIYPVDIFYAHRGATTTPSLQVQLAPEPGPAHVPATLDVVSGGFAPSNLVAFGSADIAGGAFNLLPPTGGVNDAAAGILANDVALVNGFQLEFDFVGSLSNAEGFAVVAGAGAIGAGSPGDGLGYDGLGRTIAVEFDARQNAIRSDPAHQHISIHTRGSSANSASESASIGGQPSIPVLPNGFFNGTPQHARVSYTPVTEQSFGWLRVWMNDNLLPAVEAMIDRADFASLFFPDGTGLLGFTAGRSQSTATLAINAVHLTTYPAPQQPNSAPVVETALADVSALEDAADILIPLAGHFSDPDHDPLSFSAHSDNPELIEAVIVGNNLRLHFVPELSGSAHIYVSAFDPDGLSAETALSVELQAVNDPPTLAPIPSQTLASDHGATIQLVMTAGPPAEAGQALEVLASSSDPAATTQLHVGAGNTLMFFAPFRTTTTTVNITVTVREIGDPIMAVTRTFPVTITGSGNTAPGSNVMVTAAGPVPGKVSLKFAAVTAGGQTAYTETAGGLAPPDGFTFGKPATWLDITTSAAFSSAITVCIGFDGVEYNAPSLLKMFHFENGAWVNRTSSIDTAAKVVCGVVSSLSPFALAEPVEQAPPDLEGRMHGQGGVTAAGLEYDFQFKIAERQIGLERGSLDVKITTPKGGKQKASTDRFASLAITGIAFSNDPAFKSGRGKKAPLVDSAVFTGTGKWNGLGGYRFEAKATDQGEPGPGRDRFTVTIYNGAGAIVATVDAPIGSGNIQSDRLRAENWK